MKTIDTDALVVGAGVTGRTATMLQHIVLE